MTADIYSEHHDISLLFTFQQVFRKPSGSFRIAAFEVLTYGATYEEALSATFCYLRVPLKLDDSFSGLTSKA